MLMFQSNASVSIKHDFKEIFQSDSEKNLNDNAQPSLAIAAFVERKVTLPETSEVIAIIRN